MERHRNSALPNDCMSDVCIVVGKPQSIQESCLAGAVKITAHVTKQSLQEALTQSVCATSSHRCQ